MTCCVTGHRPAGFPFSRDPDTELFNCYIQALQNEIVSLIDQGYIHFITGMAEGADLDFAKVIISLRNDFPDIVLEAAFPYPSRSTKERTKRQEDKDFVVKHCDLTYIVSDHYFNGCMHKRNRYIVDKADVVLAIWNGEQSGGTWSTIQYAISKGKKIRYIMLNDLSKPHKS